MHSPSPRYARSAQGKVFSAKSLAVLAAWAIIRRLKDRDAGSKDSRGLPGDHKASFEPHPNRDAPAADDSSGDSREPGRGRRADKPTEIPATGWKDVLWRVYERFTRDRVMAVAAGVTFYVLLAIFPAVAALVSFYGLFADPVTIQEHLNLAAGVLPGGALDIIGDQVKRIASKGGGALGLASLVGLAISLWSANAGMKALFDALNIVYQEGERRSFIKLNAESLAFTVGGIIFLLLSLGAVVVVPALLRFIGLGESFELLLSILRWPLLLVVVIVALALLYRYGPSRDNPQWRWVTPGSIVAAALWLAGSMLFSWYVANFGRYNETYGSLGAAIGFMTWIWLSTIVVLVGGAINAETEHQTAKDTTEGAPRPLGARDAHMADTVGAAKA